MQINWFLSVAEFDPKIGDPLPCSLSAFLEKVNMYKPSDTDRLQRIVDHCRDSLKHLFINLNENPKREHEFLPVRAIKELDASSFISLSRRPGRNVREKLASDPYLIAPKRYMSVDLPENQLLKEFAIRLSEILEFKQKYLNKTDELLPAIYKWLHSDEAESISKWRNLPPNNTLLSHRNYRKVLDSFRWLQNFEDDINTDILQLDKRQQVIDGWNFKSGNIYADQPVFFSFDDFEIETSDKLIELKNTTVHRSPDIAKAYETPACIDISSIYPQYATEKLSDKLPIPLVWQSWKNSNTSIELYSSKTVWEREDVSTVYSSDLFTASTKKDLRNLDSAARAFSNELVKFFRSSHFYWLVPDVADDFTLEILRRNLNSKYSNSYPLPRSIATVFSQIDYAKLKDDYKVAVIDTLGSKTFKTIITAKCDKALGKRVPETKGFYWEREPSEVIQSKNDLSTPIWTYCNGKWIEPKKHDKVNAQVDAKRIDKVIYADNNSVCGGMILHRLKSKAGDLPLWRDRLPELGMQVMINGVKSEFSLVSKTTNLSVAPIKGIKVPIEIKQVFTIPQGKAEVRSQLVQGSGKSELEFDALLYSDDFPLQSEARYKLRLTYEYGADNPYELTFIPVEASLGLSNIKAKWRPVSERPPLDLDSLPYPQYPEPDSWEKLQHYPRLEPDRDGRTESDLLEWVAGGIPINYVSGKVNRVVDKSENNKFFFLEVEGFSKNVFCHCSAFKKDLYPAEGDIINNVFIIKGDKGYSGVSEKALEKSLRFPSYVIWRDGRSLSDLGCPQAFSASIGWLIQNISLFVDKNNQLPEEIYFFLCRLNKDAPSFIPDYLLSLIGQDNVPDDFYDWVSYALGDMSCDWQKELLQRVFDLKPAIIVRILSVAIWRAKEVVEYINYDVLLKILDALYSKISDFKNTKRRDGVELLLGLLRTRQNGSNEIKALLSPDSEWGKRFTAAVSKLSDKYVSTGAELKSHVRLTVDKPDEYKKVPDLLYALQLYLSGDDGANTIRIEGISEE